MPANLTEPLLLAFSQFVASQMGLHYPPERWHDLEQGIRATAREFNFPDPESCVRWLLSAPLNRGQIEILASHLTIGETYFFREGKSFELLGGQILPELICARQDTGRRLRIWSAGCCTGEEPFSIAVLLSRMVSDLKTWNLTILATDINPRFLHKAAKGVYGEWSFRDAPRWLQENYFTETAGPNFELAPKIRQLVTFSHLNLADDVYPSLINNTNALDVIFCRNVLMYFTREGARKVIHRFHQCLVAGGWLLVSPAETSHDLFQDFETVNLDGSFFYRKSSGRADRLVPSGIKEWPFPLLITETVPVAPAMPETTLLEISPQPADDPIAPEITGGESRVDRPSPGQAAALLFREGRYMEATDQLNSHLASHRATPEALTLLAHACANLGRLDEAQKWADLALAADKLNPDLHYLRAIILQEQGNLTAAAAALRQALYIDQGFVPAHLALGHIALRQQKKETARKHFANALSGLDRYQPDTVLPESDGMTAGRLREIVQTTMLAQVLE